jgi:hypothetical protein
MESAMWGRYRVGLSSVESERGRLRVWSDGRWGEAFALAEPH